MAYAEPCSCRRCQFVRDNVTYDFMTGEFTAVSPTTKVSMDRGDKTSVYITVKGKARKHYHGGKIAAMFIFGGCSENYKVLFYDKNLPNMERFKLQNMNTFVKDTLENVDFKIFAKELKRKLCSQKPDYDGVGHIYRFVNVLTDKSYIGQSIHVDDRKEQHVKHAFKHGGTKFQEALKYYGTMNFEFSILLECHSSELDYHECRFIDKYNSCLDGYNSNLGNHYQDYYDSKDRTFENYFKSPERFQIN